VSSGRKTKDDEAYRLQFPFSKVRNGIDDDPWNAAAKVDDLERGERVAFRSGGQRTSCMIKLMSPVAIIGFPISKYHAAHWDSSQLREEKSVPAAA
jgi:hypothetical protein